MSEEFAVMIICPICTKLFLRMVILSDKFIRFAYLNNVVPGSLQVSVVPGPPQALEGEPVGSNGILLSWTMQPAPGLVTNVTAYAQNHTFVMVTWFLPRRINGLITKFAVKAKHARTGQTVRMLEVNAEEIMTGALPHCNVLDPLHKTTPSPLEITASSPPITLSAVPPAAAWNVPISVGVDQLRPYTAYLFEVSAFTSDGEGQVASTMVRMPESAPEDSPENLSVLNMTSRSISVSWNSPTIITGKFSYVLYLYGPTGFLYENSTWDMRFLFTGLTPYTRYIVAVRAKAAGEVGPAAEEVLTTPAVAEDSVSIRVSWRSPAQPNGPIIRYRLQVLADSTLLQDITLTSGPLSHPNVIYLYDPFFFCFKYTVMDNMFLLTTCPGVTVREEVVDVLSEELSYVVSDLNPFTDYTFRVTASTTAGEGPATDITEKTSEQVPSSVLEVSYQNISSTSILVSWVPPINPNGRITHYSIYGLNLRSNQALKWVTNTTSMLISDLDKYTGYKLRVAASTAVGESSLSEEDDVFVFTLEDVPGSPPYGLSYESVSPSEVNVTWNAPLQPNGVVTHYSLELWNSTHYLNLTSPTTFLHITHLRKYAQYRIVVQAHTRAGPGNFSSEPLNITTLEDGERDGLGFWEFFKKKRGGVLVNFQLLVGLHLNDYFRCYLIKPNFPASFFYLSSLFCNTGKFFSCILAPDTPPQFLQARKLSDYEVELSWEPPLNANSEILYYLVRNVTETSVVINVDSESRYNASVSSWTRLGDGGVLIYISFTTTEAEPFDPPQNVTVVNVTASSVTLMWQPPTEPNGIIVHYTIYYTDNGTVTEKVNQRFVLVTDLPVRYSPNSPFIYTVTQLIGGSNYTMWMTSSTIQGDGGVQSDSICVRVTQFYFFHFPVPSDPVSNLTAQNFSSTAIIVSWDPPTEPNGRPYYILTLQEAGIFPNMTSQGILAVNKTISVLQYLSKPVYISITTLIIGCVCLLGPSSPPLLLSTRNLSSSSIAVVWQRPLEANGEITEYTLTLSGPEGTNTTQTTNTSVILTDLVSYTAYNLTILASTRKGSGPSLLVQLHTDEGGPSTPPANLTIYNHTAVSVWLTWDPPLEPNGVVIKYGFRIQDLITQTVTHRNSSGSSTMEHLSGFRPHSSYEISVYSYTRVGHGNQFSSPVTFTTNESVSDAVGNLSCLGLSWDSVQISWEVPANPNGQILFYEITGEVNMQTFTHKADTLEYTVTGLSPDQEYVLAVAAVNSAGPGDINNCTAFTLSESVPTAPRLLSISEVTATNVTLEWKSPVSVPGLLKEYHVIAQLISTVCEPIIQATTLPTLEDDKALHCVEDNFTVSVNASDNAEESSVTLQSLAKYRYYRFKVAAVTNAGPGAYAQWSYARTLAGKPDAPPRDLKVTPTSTSLRIAWQVPAVLSGPTSYLVIKWKSIDNNQELLLLQVDGPGVNISIVRGPGELTTVFVTNLTAFSNYAVTVTAFTGSLEDAGSDGRAIGPIVFQTLEEEPKDPPKNVTVTAVPEEVNLVRVSFSPPEEPNGNITTYYLFVYEKDRLIKNMSLDNIHGEPNMLVAFIEGLKGGHTYSIQVRNSYCIPHVQITTGIKAPSKPTQRPQAVLGQGGVAIVTHRSITIRMPACFYSDDNGPIAKIQVIVAESGVRDSENLTNWRTAYHQRPAPYFTDAGFPNPTCLERDRAAGLDMHVNDNCMQENNTDHFCNGPLKANTVYVFKFRATNINGQYTDSEFSEHIRTTADGLLTKEEQIILGVLLSFFLAVLLILLICCSVKIHQRKKEGGTYSPREAEIIETKCKLDQLIAVADMELKQEKLNRPVNKKSFLQHVEDLCANDNSKFQEEFSDLPKLLPDLATTDADLPWNKSKNRFLNIKPYNNNRVKLLSEPGMAGSDYVNASFVSGYLCPNEFIATQGPLPSTVADFWRMIWETGTRTVAMLTQCYEKGRIRCHKYWPEDNKPMTVFSDILISKVSEEVLPDWTVRTLKVEKHGHYILVKHFNYTSWPEHGVPESCSTLIKFVKAVRAHRHDNSTIVVHCSAGVGRTGVFIALDHLIQHIRDHDFVDIYGLVAELRSERMCMVQNLAQYIFLHQSTLELLNNKGNSQSIWFVNYSALEKMDSLDAMEGDVELEWEETTM
uniref:Protein tyrosine phosphatase receptor type Q n=1 Tax=Cyprinodon variegatus TaxID=28743 RepID=A0A3Q2DRQ3_CYPVA